VESGKRTTKTLPSWLSPEGASTAAREHPVRSADKTVISRCRSSLLQRRRVYDSSSFSSSFIEF
jgi:hypothetical protein